MLHKIKVISPSVFTNQIILKDSSFSVRSGTTLSNISKIEAGVPQKAVIAQLLFNIYTADQPFTQNTTDFMVDKALFVCHCDPDITSSFIQIHLNVIVSWYTAA